MRISARHARSTWRHMMANRVFVRYFSSRYNPLGVQMLSKSLYEQVFGMEAKQTFSKEQIQCGIDHLTRHGLWGRHVDPLPDVDIKLPPLTAKNINDHFVNLANQQLGPYLPLINSLTSGDLPPRPSKWNYQAGWTKYDHLTNTWEWVRCPDDGALVLDVEVCVREGHAPTLAVAVSPDNWYSWVSKRLMEDQDYLKRSKVTLDDLIPMEDGDLSRERIIVGHNVSYDRARIKEQYFIKNMRTKFLDTLSLHVCVAGQTSIQKSLSSANKRDKISTDENNDKIANEPKWSLVGSSNSLAEVYKLHCGGDEIDKSIRDVFVSGTITQIRDKFQVVYPLFQYHCPHPVTLAGMLEMNSMYLPVNSSWKKFVQSSKFAAEDLEWEMSTKLMSLADSACAHAIDESYKKDVWLYNLDWSSKKLRSKKRSPREMKRLMERLREMDGKDGHEEDGQYQLVVSVPDQSKRRVHKPGYPEWYRQLCININQSPWQPGPALISPNMRVVPYLLRMKWNNHPLYYHPALAWGYIVPTHLRPSQIPQWGHNDIIIKSPNGSSPDIEDMLTVMDDSNVGGYGDEDVTMVTDTGSDSPPGNHPPNDVVFIDFGCGQLERSDKKRRRIETDFGLTDDVVVLGGHKYYYFKLPHKNGSEANCGNPLAKDYMSKMSSGLLVSSIPHVGERILELNTMVSYWRSIQKRIDNQFVVWMDGSGCGESQGVIIPLTMVAGTVTRRAVESTWLTASNAKVNRIGSEMKCMIQSPSGYKLVGADVDSQEVWIASLLGDEHFTGIQGSTAFGWMNLQGSKSDGTDIHSKTAQTIGISREQAKVFNYGRIYGAGLALSNMLLKQFNPSMSESEAQSKSVALYKSTKGERRLILSKSGQSKALGVGMAVHEDGSVNQSDWYNKFNSHHVRGVVKGRYWHNGTESHMFNKLEGIANSAHPRTPVLNCLISRSLQPKNVGNKFLTSRINWIVQSSGVDYLHLLLVSMNWLMDYFSINGRLCISIHDEVRYIIAEDDKYIASLALQVSNLWTRAMFAYQLGMEDLPMSVAFFSAVDVDDVLRKEVTIDGVTPSNPLGLRKGYHIEYGESLDIYQTIDKLTQE